MKLREKIWIQIQYEFHHRSLFRKKREMRALVDAGEPLSSDRLVRMNCEMTNHGMALCSLERRLYPEET